MDFGGVLTMSEWDSVCGVLDVTTQPVRNSVHAGGKKENSAAAAS